MKSGRDELSNLIQWKMKSCYWIHILVVPLMSWAFFYLCSEETVLLKGTTTGLWVSHGSNCDFCKNCSFPLAIHNLFHFNTKDPFVGSENRLVMFRTILQRHYFKFRLRDLRACRWYLWLLCNGRLLAKNKILRINVFKQQPPNTVSLA